MELTLDFDQERMRTIEQIFRLAGRKEEYAKAQKSAANRAAMAAKTVFKQQIRARYTVKAGKLKAEISDEVEATTSSPTAVIALRGPMSPVTEFKVSPKAPKTDKGKTVPPNTEIRVGNQAQWPHAFIAKMPSGHIGLFSRDPNRQMEDKKGRKKREALKQRFSLSSVHMAQGEEIQEAVTKRAQEILAKRMEHELERMLSK